MKFNLLTSTALAVIIALPALAATDATSPTIGQRLDNGVAATQQTMDNAAESVRNFMADKDTTGSYPTLTVNMKASTSGIIGQPVYNVGNTEVAKVEDILFDQSGNATKVILANGGLMGIGAKLVAVDFGLVYVRTNNSDVIVPITEDTIKKMTPFSYDVTDAKDGMVTIPAGQMSAKAMLDGHLVNDKGTEVATIENITLSNGDASQVIVAYNTTLGMGGNKLALSYDQLQKVANGDEIDFKLTSTLSSRFETYTKATN